MRRSIKTTLTRVGEFMNHDTTETSFIPLHSCRRAQRSSCIRMRIGAVVVEESPIGLCDCQGSYKDKPYKGYQFHEF